MNRHISNITPPMELVTCASRAALKNQNALCIWFTGLSGAGKSTLAHHFDRWLYARGKHSFVLDGDHLRHGLCQDLTFSIEDRRENIRRVAEVSRLMVDAGLIVLVSFISPFQRDRDAARMIFPDGKFFEVFVDAPLVECERRDVKGLYAKARQGLIPDFTGIGSPYEVPESPDLRIDTSAETIEDCVLQIARLIRLT